MPGNYSRLWPTHRTSAKLHRSCVRRSGWRYQGLGLFTPAWICVLHQREAAPTRLRAGWAEGLTSTRECPGLTAACGMPPARLRLPTGTRRGSAHSPWICVLHQPCGCTDSPRRVGSAEGFTAACGPPWDLWPLVACPLPRQPSSCTEYVRKHERVGSAGNQRAAAPLWYQEGFRPLALDLCTAPAERLLRLARGRARSAEGITAACGQPRDLWPLVACPLHTCM